MGEFQVRGREIGIWGRWEENFTTKARRTLRNTKKSEKHSQQIKWIKQIIHWQLRLLWLLLIQSALSNEVMIEIHLLFAVLHRPATIHRQPHQIHAVGHYRIYFLPNVIKNNASNNQPNSPSNIARVRKRMMMLYRFKPMKLNLRYCFRQGIRMGIWIRALVVGTQSP